MATNNPNIPLNWTEDGPVSAPPPIPAAYDWSARHKALATEYEAWEQSQRAAGALWSKVAGFTEWIYRRMDTAEAALAAERDKGWNEALQALANCFHPSTYRSIHVLAAELSRPASTGEPQK
jgi:hypothetical protein